MGPLETEIKLRMENGAADAVDLLQRHGFRASSARILQIDRVFDLPDGELRRSRRLLRIRSHGDASILTYKGPPLPGPHKSREELEVSVGHPFVEQSSSGAPGLMLAAILDRLGYKPYFHYEKYRTTFSIPGEDFHSAVIALDETPIGVFLELEGPADWIDRTASTLGFRTSDYILSSYAALYEKYVQKYGGPSDMKF